MLLVVLFVLRMKFDKSVFYVKNRAPFDSGCYVTLVKPLPRTSHHNTTPQHETDTIRHKYRI
jgi:hypothetical protein